MPHKVNPIRFENAEANLELSVGRARPLARTLVTSRLQRDLTDSTTQRNIGVGFGHSLLALDNLQRGLDEVDVDRGAARRPTSTPTGRCSARPSRRWSAPRSPRGAAASRDPYALVKELTRGKRVTRRPRRVRPRPRPRRGGAGAAARAHPADLHGPRRRARRRLSSLSRGARHRTASSVGRHSSVEDLRIRPGIPSLRKVGGVSRELRHSPASVAGGTIAFVLLGVLLFDVVDFGLARLESHREERHQNERKG